MVAPFSCPAPGITVLLFGPHFLSFNEESLSQLRSTLLEAPENRWILHIIAELPGYYGTLSKAFPRLQYALGEKLLEDLSDWLFRGTLTQASFPLPNILLTPLVVITQLVQYSRFLQLARPGSEDGHDAHAFSKPDAEIVGFCTGLLSALVVSSSTSQAQFQQYGANAVRLAMLIGALVDSHDTPADIHGESKSFSVAWSSPGSAAEITRILSLFPEVRSLS